VNKWNEVTLGTLAPDSGAFVDGPFGSCLKASEYLNSGVPVIRLQNIKPNNFNAENLRFISNLKAKELQRHNFKVDDVIITKLGEPCGIACQVPNNQESGIIVADVVRFRGDLNRINHRYLIYFLNSPYGQRQVSRLAKGTTRQRINLSDIKKIRIPLPPLEEQKRIAAILDKADAIRRKRIEAIALTEELLRSTFLEMFGDPVTNPKGWKTDLFGNVGVLNRGKSKHRPRNDPSLLNGKYPLIQTGDVANCKGVIETYTQTYSEKGLAQSKMWDAGTLCITIAANIAETGILGFDACFPDSVVGFQPNEKTTNEYVQGWLQFLQPVLEDRAPQSAQKNINLEILRKLDLPVPPIELQRKFSALTQKIRDSAGKNESNEVLLDNLFNSLLQKAFRGEL
jgi:type I restriction enzyme S subunit